MSQEGVLFCFFFFFSFSPPYKTLEKFPKQEDGVPHETCVEFHQEEALAHLYPNVFPSDSGLRHRFTTADKQLCFSPSMLPRRDEKGKTVCLSVCFLTRSEQSSCFFFVFFLSVEVKGEMHARFNPFVFKRGNKVRCEMPMS